MTDTVIETVEPTVEPVAVQQPGTPMGSSLVELDPAELMAHPLNLREDLSVEEMLPSVRELGLLQNPIVALVDGAWRILAGHRRIAAAVAAGLTTVECVVRQDLARDVDALFTMLVENADRKALTTTEQAKGFQQLLDLGVSATKVAKRTGRKRRDITEAVTAIGNPASAEAVGAGLTIPQALVIAEFEDDPEAVAALYEAAATGDEFDFKRLAARLRKNRDDAAKRAETLGALAASGVTVIDLEAGKWPRRKRLDSLVTGDDTKASLTPDNHAGCPGHAVAANPNHADEVDYYCTDPEAHQHQNRYDAFTFDGDGRRKGPMTEAEKAERREVIANNKAWDVAVEIRREFVREFVQRKRPPKGLLRWCIEEIMRNPGYVGDGGDGMLADILKVTAKRGSYGRDVGITTLGNATDVALPLVLFAQIAADREVHMKPNDPLGRNCWRSKRETEARYLVQLQAMGFGLSDVEKLCVEQVFRSRKAPAPAPAPEPVEASEDTDDGAVEDPEPVDEDALVPDPNDSSPRADGPDEDTDSAA